MRAGAFLVSTLMAFAVLPGCGNEREESRPDAGAIGVLTMALTSSNGAVTYRLLDATFEIEGPSNQTVSSAPEDTQIDVVLPEGGYTVTLLEGWSLERSARGVKFTPVNAVLAGPASQGFTITDQETTSVTFSFRAGENVIEFGNGRLVIDFEVVDSDTGANGDVQIECGSEVCTGADICCRDSGTAAPRGCVLPSSCANGLPQTCDGTDDCGGDACCINPSRTAIECTTRVCNDFQVCNPSDPECPFGRTCSRFPIPGVDLFVCLD